MTCPLTTICCLVVNKRRFPPLLGRQARHVEQPVPVVPQVYEALESVEAHRSGLADIDDVLGFADGQFGNLGVRERFAQDVADGAETDGDSSTFGKTFISETPRSQVSEWQLPRMRRPSTMLIYAVHFDSSWRLSSIKSG